MSETATSRARPAVGPQAGKPEKASQIKCVVWDLDGTVWNGVLLEGGATGLRPGVADAIRGLDERGILQSVASKNEPGPALARLREFGLEAYFLYPQIGWGPKSQALARIAEKLNIGKDTFAFIDDQPFEREEVAFSHPEVRVLDAAQVESLLERAEMKPRFLTEDARNRRVMYLADRTRQEAEEGVAGPQENFLATLGMRCTLKPAGPGDLQRAEELTVRTNQLNTTGVTYAFEELDFFRASPDHLLLIAGLEDKYGAYGKIGLALVEKGKEAWDIKLLLMSCRVMSRGVGSVVINHVRSLARAAGVRLLADFVANDRNRMMYMTYRFLGFREIGKDADHVRFEADLENIPAVPRYLQLET